MPKDSRLPVETTIALPCACANLRRAARTVTQFYDDILRPSGMRVTQFTLLQALTLAPRISQKELARLLESDSTTLTRTLAHLRRKGWLSSVPASDRRQRGRAGVLQQHGERAGESGKDRRSQGCLHQERGT